MVPPRAVVELVVHVDSRLSPARNKDKLGVVRLTTDDEHDPYLSIELRMKVTSAFQCVPAELDLQRIARNGGALGRVDIAAIGDSGRRLLDVLETTPEIGATLAETTGQLSSGGGWRLMLSACAVRCGAAPVLLFLAARYLPASEELKQVRVEQASRPGAVFPIVLARHYCGDTLTAVRVVVSTSVIGFVTIPLWVRFGLGFVLGRR